MKKADIEPTTDYAASNIKTIEGLGWDCIDGKPKKNIIVTTKRRKGRVSTSPFVATSAEPNNFNGRIRHVEFKPGNVKKQRIPPTSSNDSSIRGRGHRPVYTASKVSMAGFTVRGIESEISYVQAEWPTVMIKELGDNGYDFFREPYQNTPKEHRRIAYHISHPYPDKLSLPEYSIIRIAVTSSNVDDIPVFQDLQSVFDLNRYYSSKRGQYKGGTGELGDALKRMLKMGYASWTSHYFNQGEPNIQWNEPIILTFNKKRYLALLHVDTEIEEAKVVITQDRDAVIDSPDTTVSVAIPIVHDYTNVVLQLKRYYNIYKIPKIRTSFSFSFDAESKSTSS